MKKPVAAVLAFAMLVALAAPAAALARNGKAATNNPGTDPVASSPSAPKGPDAAEHAARSAEKAQAEAAREATKDARVAQRMTDKKARVAEHAAAKAAREASRVAGVDNDSDEPSRSVNASRSAEGTRTVNPGLPRAFSRITANLEKSLAKIADGSKSQLPPGLVRAWLMFAGWLGVDKSTVPAVPMVAPVTTSTVVPTSTVEPTTTVVPTATIEATVTP